VNDQNIIDIHMHELRKAAEEVARAAPIELVEIAIESLNALAHKFPGIASRDQVDPAFLFAKACMLKLEHLLQSGALREEAPR
jgi:hypothetical protein